MSSWLPFRPKPIKVRLDDLISVGHFCEEGYSNSHQQPSIRDLIGERPQEHESRIVTYLRTAPAIAGRSGVQHDILDPTSRKPMCVGVHSDGVFVWHSTYAYYVEKYHVRIPADLHAHLLAANWEPPSDVEIDHGDWAPPPTIRADGTMERESDAICDESSET